MHIELPEGFCDIPKELEVEYEPEMAGCFDFNHRCSGYDSCGVIRFLG